MYWKRMTLLVLSCLWMFSLLNNFNAQANEEPITEIDQDQVDEELVENNEPRKDAEDTPTPNEDVEDQREVENIKLPSTTPKDNEEEKHLEETDIEGPDTLLDEVPDENILRSAEEDLFGWSGVSAEIKRVVNTSEHGRASVQVKTNNEKTHEGVVLSESPIKPNSDYEFTVYVKGEGDILLKVEETNFIGRFLKETDSNSILLTDEWQQVKLPIKTASETAQVDLFVLTSSKQDTIFYVDQVEFK